MDSPCSLIIFRVFQNVAGLTVQRLADGIKRAEANGPDLTGFEAGKVDI